MSLFGDSSGEASSIVSFYGTATAPLGITGGFEGQTIFQIQTANIPDYDELSHTLIMRVDWHTNIIYASVGAFTRTWTFGFKMFDQDRTPPGIYDEGLVMSLSKVFTAAGQGTFEPMSRSYTFKWSQNPKTVYTGFHMAFFYSSGVVSNLESRMTVTFTVVDKSEADLGTYIATLS